MSATVACIYCGGHHARATDVRACWGRTQRADASVPPPPTPLQASGTVSGSGMRPVLGRSVVVAAGQAPPDAWAGCDRADGGLDDLEAAWRDRRPVMIEATGEVGGDEV